MTRRGDLTVPDMPNPDRDRAIDAMIDTLLDEIKARAWDAGYETGWDDYATWVTTDQFTDYDNPHRRQERP